MKIAVFTGAGISAESGIPTYRDQGGIWLENHVNEVASVEAWKNTPNIVLNFHNTFRAKCRDIKPNAAHIALAELEKHNDVTLITQNVDDLHEKGGSTNVLHIHGELFKSRNSFDEISFLEGDLNIGDLDEYGEQLRPHTVLFGEYPFQWEESIKAIAEADLFIVIGTSFSIGYTIHILSSCKPTAKVIYIDSKPDLGINMVTSKDIEVIKGKAGEEVPKLVKHYV